VSLRHGSFVESPLLANVTPTHDVTWQVEHVHLPFTSPHTILLLLEALTCTDEMKPKVE
jgi:hypothetical protein